MPCKDSEKALTWSFLPADLISHDNSACDGELCSVMGRHLHFRYAVFQRLIDCRLGAVVRRRKGDDCPVWHRVAVTVANRIRCQLNLLARLLSVHFQPAWVAWYLPYDADAGNFTNSGHKSINALLCRGVHYCPGSPILCVNYVLLPRSEEHTSELQ